VSCTDWYSIEKIIKEFRKSLQEASEGVGDYFTKKAVDKTIENLNNIMSKSGFIYVNKGKGTLFIKTDKIGVSENEIKEFLTDKEIEKMEKLKKKSIRMFCEDYSTSGICSIVDELDEFIKNEILSKDKVKAYIVYKSL
jgi:hypothetical protein